MEKVAVHTIVDCDDYTALLDEFRMDDGGQMLVAHIEVHRYAPSVLKYLKRDFALFRFLTDAPIFAFEPTPDDAKWERFIRQFNFQFCCRVGGFPDGTTRRFFLSVPHGTITDKNDDGVREQASACRADAVPYGRLEAVAGSPNYQPE